MIKLVLSDMDNTLVPFGNRRVSDFTRKAIHTLLEETDIAFGPCTGRDYVELMRLFSLDEACMQTGVMSTGKRVLYKGKTISLSVFDHKTLQGVADAIADEKNMFLVCYPEQTNLFNPAYVVGAPDNKDILADYERRMVFVSGIVDQVPDDVDFVAATVACPGTEEDMERCRQKVAAACPDVYTMSVVPQWFDVLPKGVSKLTGFETLLERTGISPEEVLVFGDGENDVEILSKVPHSVAVANAIPEVKQVARHHVGASADDGVAHALLELVRATKAGETPRFMMEN